MYTIFYNDSYIYDPYENLECVTDVKLTANVNAAAYLDFTISPKHPLYNVVEERSGIVKVYYDNEKLFEGVVDSIEMDMYGYKSISCVSALDYLGDTRTRSYHTGSVEPTDKSKGVKAPESIDQFFQWLIDQHNQHVQNSNKTFIVGVNQGSSFSESNVIDVESTSHESTADAITNNLIDRYGGYLTLTYDGEQRVLNLYSDVHEMNAQIMDFGVNITDFTKTTTTEDQYTAVYPVGGTPENKNENDKNTYPPIDISSLPNGTTEQDADIVKNGDVIFSRSAVARYGYKEYYYSENNILDATNLLKAAIIALRKSMSPKVSIDVKAVDCALFMKGYHHLAVGEAVRVRSNPHKVDEYLMVSSIELDLQNPENTEYTLGTSYDTLTGQQSSYLRSLNSTINSAVDSVGALDKTSKETAKTAQEAKANSIVAKDTADTAKNTADTANTTANKAQSTATTAKNTADKAQTTATEASKTATEAKAVADTANKATEDLKKKTAEIDKQVEAVSNAADAASAKADQVRTDLTQQVQNVKSEMDTAVEAAQTSANKAQSAADAAQKAADKANASTVDLDKSIKAVDAKAIAAKQAAAEAQSKAENVASDLDSANAVIEQHTTELGELTTKVTNAVKKSDSALSVSTEAKQTATEASTTATSAYKDSQTALTQSTTATQTATAAKTTAESASKTASDSLKQSSAAVQTANQISTTLRTEYQTKADADKIYATQSSLKQTSDSITASVSKTYATKDALSALQNVADNAIESWRGTGVPTLENKPASDWTTNDDKKKHSGDLYYDKSTGKAYRFGSDDGVTYTWELNQDTDVTKALEDASKAQTSANNAQASATAANTAAGKAQLTANTAVSNAATAKNTADAAQSSANKAQGDVDKLKIDIPETYATKSSLTQTAESITANVESVKSTANSAVTAASKAQQTADGISVNLTKNYQTKSQADTIYATKASLKATSDSISAEVTKAQGTADGAVTAASKAQQTADAVTLNLSKNYNTKAQNDALYATQTSLKATSDSLSANITANAKTAQSAVDKATSLEANLNGFKTTVSQTYGHGSNLWVNPTFDADKPQIGSLVDDVTAPNGSKVNLLTIRDYYNSATDFPVVPRHTYVITAHIKRLKGDVRLTAGIWYTVQTSGYSWDGTTSAESTSDLSDGWMAATWRITCRDGKSRGCVYFHIEQPISNLSTQWYISNVTCVDVTGLQPAGDYATNSSLTQTANSIKAQVTEVSKTANGAMSKATTVEQTANGLSSKITEQGKTLNATVKTANEAKSTADSNKATISQVSTTAGNALTKASSVEQNLNGFKTTVSETYTTKNDFNNLTIGGTNLLLNSNFSKGTDNWVLDLQNNGLGTVKAEALSGVDFATTMLTINVTKSTTNLCRIYQLRSPNPMRTDTIDTISFWANASESVDVKFGVFDSPISITVEPGWHYYKKTISKWTKQAAFSIIFQNGFVGKLNITKIMLEHASKASQWSPAPEDLQPAGDYSTKSYVDQTAKSVALGVVQNYKGSDGSGLATKSDITVAKDSITTTVSKTYQTKADMKNYATQSQLTQTNDKVTIAFQNSQSVGGQNLLLKTSVPTVVTGSGAANQIVAMHNLAAGNLSNLPAGMYNIQFKIKSDTAGGTARPQWNDNPWGMGDGVPNIDIGTSEQTYSKHVYVSNTNHPNVKGIAVRLDNAKGNVTIREMKLEPGNSMTPWTAAPEDTINDLTNTVQNQADALGKTVDSDTFNKYTSDTNNTLTHNKNDLDNLSDTVRNEIKYREAYIEFGTDLTNPYMDMGTAGNMAKLHLTNTELDFMQANAKVAWFSNQQLVVNNSTVNDSLTIGNFVFRYRSNGHLTLQHI